MTREEEPLFIERKLVVVFDICSSTTILEDLKRTDNLAQWRNFIINLKNILFVISLECDLIEYNFIGDGWVLLFPDSISTDDLCRCLSSLSLRFSNEFRKLIRPLLSQAPVPNGLTFGIDSGDLIRVQMNEQPEYLGRAINVAARLQGCARELPGGPSYKAVFSPNSFYRPSMPSPTVEFERHTVSLRNITPPNMECFVFQALQPSGKASDGHVPNDDVLADKILSYVRRAKQEHPNRAFEESALCLEMGVTAEHVARAMDILAKRGRAERTGHPGMWFIHP
jgi:hypothetical protein